MEQISDAAVKENPSLKPTENLPSDDTHPHETDSIHQPNDGTHLANIVGSEDASFKSEDDVGDNDKPFDTSCQSVNESHDDLLTDEYHYLKTGEYTSEIYKVVVRNIPRGISYGRFRSTIQRILGSNPKKIKYHKGSHYAFVACCDEEQRQKALTSFNNYKWKDRVLTCKKAAPAHDPYVRERKRRIENGSNDRASKKSKMSQNTSLPPEVRILHAVCPYVTYSYEEQIRLKEEEMERCISALTGSMIKNLHGSAGSWLNKERLITVSGFYTARHFAITSSMCNQIKNFNILGNDELKRGYFGTELKGSLDKLCLQLLPIIISPVVSQYRNKVEFTIGVGPDGKGFDPESVPVGGFGECSGKGLQKIYNTIGFILGSYKAGTLAIVQASKCINCTLASVAVAKEFQDFIQTLPYPSYNVGTHIGLWQQMTVRTCRSGDVMVIIQINGSYFSKEEETERLKKDIEQFYLDDSLKTKVISVYFSMSSKSNTLNVGTYQHLCFEKHIYEELLQLKFRISPDAFFQVNTPATELLYTQVYDWCDTQQDDACVLDVCCGTGTIGLCIAKKTSLPVIGVEICEQAVEDARHNAAINDISNAQFVCGPAEKVLQNEIQKINKKNIIAVVDPPRAGLHGNVITLLRNCRAIKRIIYVACSAKMASQNFVSLCRPRSKRFEGAPFKTVRAVPIDLFPQTPHCELIVELERVDIEQEEEWPVLKSSESINEAVTSCESGMNKDMENINTDNTSVDSKSRVDNTDTL